jgi:hypothetical protein
LYTGRFIDRKYGSLEFEEDRRDEPVVHIGLGEGSIRMGLTQKRGVRYTTLKTEISVDDFENYVKVLRYWIYFIIND